MAAALATLIKRLLAIAGARMHSVARIRAVMQTLFVLQHSMRIKDTTVYSARQRGCDDEV
jgi:hypothetical protein